MGIFSAEVWNLLTTVLPAVVTFVVGYLSRHFHLNVPALPKSPGPANPATPAGPPDLAGVPDLFPDNPLLNLLFKALMKGLVPANEFRAAFESHVVASKLVPPPTEAK